MTTAKVHRSRCDQDWQPLPRDYHVAPRIARTKATTRSTGTSPGTRSTRSQRRSPPPGLPWKYRPPQAQAVHPAPGSGATSNDTNAGSLDLFSSVGRVGIKSAGSVKRPCRACRRQSDSRCDIMPSGNIHNPRAQLKALRYNPRLHNIGPTPVSTPRYDYLESTHKSICHAQSPSAWAYPLAYRSPLSEIFEINGT